VDDLAAAPTVSTKLAALLPIPVFLRRGRGGDAAGVAGGQGSNLAAQVSSTLGAAAEPVAATWSKAAAAVAALAFAGAGAGVAVKQDVPLPNAADTPLVRALKGGEAKAGHATLTAPAEAGRVLRGRSGTDTAAARGGESSTTVPGGAGGSPTPSGTRQAGGGSQAASGGAAGPGVPSVPGQQPPKVDVPQIGGRGDGPGAGARPAPPEQPQTAGGGGGAPIVSVPKVELPSAGSAPSPPTPPVDVRAAVSSAVGG
jgi:hypothetical protein